MRKKRKQDETLEMMDAVIIVVSRGALEYLTIRSEDPTDSFSMDQLKPKRAPLSEGIIDIPHNRRSVTYHADNPEPVVFHEMSAVTCRLLGEQCFIDMGFDFEEADLDALGEICALVFDWNRERENPQAREFSVGRDPKTAPWLN